MGRASIGTASAGALPGRPRRLVPRRSPTSHPRPRVGLVTLALAMAVIGAGGCGGGKAKVSAASLHPRLLAASAVPGYFLARTLGWSDPVDLVGEGLFLPEIVHPSQAVKMIDGAGFEGAAGEKLDTNAMSDEITTGVMEFKSASSATKIRDWMHGEDLHEPCFTACIYTPRNLTIGGVRDARAVAQVPSAPKPPPLSRGLRRAPVFVGGPPTRYLAEFVIGRYVYFGWTEGQASDQTKFVTLAKDYYYARAKTYGG
jgi:hypothetical protein